MASKGVNLYTIQGETFNYSIALQNSDGSVFDTANVVTVAGSIRKSWISNTSTDFVATTNNGTLSLVLTSDQTAAMVPGRYIYDVKFVDPANNVSKPIYGIFTVAPGSTQ